MNVEANTTYMVNSVETTAEDLARMLSPALKLNLTSPITNSSNHDNFELPIKKNPFLIGVSGGTASGKVRLFYLSSEL